MVSYERKSFLFRQAKKYLAALTKRYQRLDLQKAGGEDFQIKRHQQQGAIDKEV